MKDITIGDVQIVIQNLLKEGVAVRDLKTILETISLQSKINKNPNFLTEHVRQALSRNICKQNLADTGDLYVITLSPDIENTIAKELVLMVQVLHLIQHLQERCLIR